MTALGDDAPNVVGLVYIAAFGLDQGESLGALLGGGPPTPALAHMVVDEQGYGWLPEDDFVGHFAADVDPTKARVMYAVQQGLSLSTFEDVIGSPPGSRARRGTSLRPTTRRSLRTQRGCSPSAWAPPWSRCPRATSRWSLTRMR
jgi:hypothetical protein